MKMEIVSAICMPKSATTIDEKNEHSHTFQWFELKICSANFFVTMLPKKKKKIGAATNSDSVQLKDGIAPPEIRFRQKISEHE